MKRYTIYRNIRKRALIFGLPLTHFAIVMISLLASLLIIIFSFGFLVLMGVVVFNLGLYFALIKVAVSPQLFHFSSPFPDSISNKKTNTYNYGQD